MPRIQVQLYDLAPAFNNGSRNAHFYLDTESGQVLLDFDGMMYDEHGDDIRYLLEDDRDRFIQIESIGSRMTEQMMRAFIAIEPAQDAREALQAALESERPFQNFRNTIFDFPEARQRWSHFEDQWVENLARDWLRQHGVEADLVVVEPNQGQ